MPPANSLPVSQFSARFVIGAPQVLRPGTSFFVRRKCSFPPNRPYECATDLLPEAPLPSTWFYKFSGPEREAMETCIKDSLALSII